MRKEEKNCFLRWCKTEDLWIFALVGILDPKRMCGIIGWGGGQEERRMNSVAGCKGGADTCMPRTGSEGESIWL